MYEAIAVGLIMALAWMVEKMAGTSMVMRPLVVSPLVGAALGDVTTGLLIGATLGAGLGTAFAIMSGKGAETALALALPISILAQSIKVALFIVRSWMMGSAMKLAGEANIRGLHLLNFGGLMLQCLMYFLVGFLAVSVGSTAVSAFVDSIPQVIMDGLTLAGGMIPAVGFALLLQPMMNGKNFIYFLIGFVLFAYLKLPVMAITIIGVGVAFIVAYENGSEGAAAATVDEGDDLFDE